MAQAVGGGVWDGWIALDTATWLRFGDLGWYLFMYNDGLPVRLIADHVGLTVTMRSPLLTRIKALSPVTIPWSEIAGARQRGRGYRTVAGGFSLAALTDVTVDVVGSSAEEWRLQFDDDYDDDPEWSDRSQDDDQDRLEQSANERAEHADDDLWQEYTQEVNGPDWRAGTAAFRFTTATPVGLIEFVELRRTGQPWTAAG